MWGLVNNAGISTFGEVEFTSMETYKEVAEVNLWGTVRTTKSFLPLIRRAKGELGRDFPPDPWTCPTFSSLLRVGTGLSRSTSTAEAKHMTQGPCGACGWRLHGLAGERDVWFSEVQQVRGQQSAAKANIAVVSLLWKPHLEK